jgi:hypothetical protein
MGKVFSTSMGMHLKSIFIVHKKEFHVSAWTLHSLEFQWLKITLEHNVCGDFVL